MEEIPDYRRLNSDMYPELYRVFITNSLAEYKAERTNTNLWGVLGLHALVIGEHLLDLDLSSEGFQKYLQHIAKERRNGHCPLQNEESYYFKGTLKHKLVSGEKLDLAVPSQLLYREPFPAGVHLGILVVDPIIGHMISPDSARNNAWDVGYDILFDINGPGGGRAADLVPKLDPDI
jgi:hypothetical protein